MGRLKSKVLRGENYLYCDHNYGTYEKQIMRPKERNISQHIHPIV